MKTENCIVCKLAAKFPSWWGREGVGTRWIGGGVVALPAIGFSKGLRGCGWEWVGEVKLISERELVCVPPPTFSIIYTYFKQFVCHVIRVFSRAITHTARYSSTASSSASASSSSSSPSLLSSYSTALSSTSPSSRAAQRRRHWRHCTAASPYYVFPFTRPCTLPSSSESAWEGVRERARAKAH